jgi:hypothetical protein
MGRADPDLRGEGKHGTPAFPSPASAELAVVGIGDVVWVETYEPALAAGCYY